MKTAERQPTVVELDQGDFLELLVARRPLKRVWPRNRDEAELRGALRDAETGAIYTRRLVRTGRPRDED